MMSTAHVELDAVNKQFASKGLSFTDLQEDKTGFINKTIFLTEASGKEYVLRLCSERDEFKNTKTKAEVNTLIHASKFPGVPAPKVFDFDSTNENFLKFEYILMEKLEGIRLGQVIPSASSEDITKIMEDLVEKMLPLWNTRFEKIGCLDEKMKPSKMPLFDQGPFDDQYEMFPVSMERILDSSPPGSISDKFRNKVMNLGVKLCDEYREKSIKSHSFCFAHWDLNFDNILVNDKTVTGIVDWEWSSSAPIDQEIFNCDFYREEKFRAQFLELLTKKLNFDVQKAMADMFDLNALGLGTLVYSWHKIWGLTEKDQLVIQWVGELRKLFEKYELGDL